MKNLYLWNTFLHFNLFKSAYRLPTEKKNNIINNKYTNVILTVRHLKTFSDKFHICSFFHLKKSSQKIKSPLVYHDILPVCVLMCVHNWLFVLYFLSQSGNVHLNGLSPVCVLRWHFKSDVVREPLPQTEQMNFLSPVWVILWFDNPELLAKT